MSGSPAPGAAPLVELAGVSRLYGSLRALDAVSLAIPAGQWLAVTGPSGSGKTTLLNLLAALDRPTAGRVRVAGEEIAALPPRERARYRRERVGLVFQEFHLLPYLTAVENVMLAQYVHSTCDRQEAAAALERVGLGHRLDHLPSQLSGGEKQRLCVARALINHPLLLLADEPTGNLDAANEQQVLTLFRELHAAGMTLVVVTHNREVAELADRGVRLEHGRLRELSRERPRPAPRPVEALP
ncbi:MAG TPA: ABC transporter ATP-binding protein [Thermoanaerobaculia bacterium]|nr:ABC transporter ATP-binding protein [Thermoanaerobaculia bacterium]